MAFWTDALERSLRAGAAALASLWLVGDQLNVLNIDWAQSGGIAAGAALGSLLLSLIGTTQGDPASASLLGRDTGRHRN